MIKGLAVLALAVSIAYFDRTSIAHIVTQLKSEHNFSNIEAGYILSAFGWGYVAGLPFSGYTITRFGYARTLRFIAAGWIISCLSFALSSSEISYFISRFILGLTEAPLFPLFASWITSNSSSKDISSRISIVEAFSYVGMALSGPIIVYMSGIIYWKWAYALLSLIGLFPLFFAFYVDTPVSNSGSHEKERVNNRSFTKNLLAIFILCSVGFCTYNIIKSFYSSWFPALLTTNYGYSKQQAAQITFWQSLIAPFASVVTGILSSFIMRQNFSLMWSRSIPMTICFTAGMSSVFLTVFPDMLTTLSIISFVGVIATSSLIWSTPGDFTRSGTEVAYFSGYMNALANIGTIMGPIIFGYLIEGLTDKSYVFMIAGALSLLALIPFLCAYFFFGKKHNAEKMAAV